MSKFQTYTIDNAPAASKAGLEDTKRAFGFVPNLQAHMAESPALLAGYSALWELFSKSTLTPHEQQVVYLTSNFENNCHYCMAGHSTLAKMIKMDPGVIAALRAGSKRCIGSPRLWFVSGALSRTPMSTRFSPRATPVRTSSK